MYRFGLTIFLSAFLLFQVQPLVSKRILPWFGGSPAVWTTCMLFFQLLLLGGYVYAHLISTRLEQRRQAQTHAAVLGLAALVLPLLFIPLFVGAHWKPETGDFPIGRIVLLLTATVGLPYFALASTSPLLQKWFLVERPTGAVYRLYALSNVGSLLALVTFPVLMEPYFATRVQAIGWAAAFALFAAMSAWCGFRAARAAGAAQPPAPDAAEAEEEKVPLATWALWLLLPACASMMLLAVTNQMCQDMAVVPFLWVLPLSLYLISFIICFDSEYWYQRAIFWPLLAVTIVIMMQVLKQGAYASILAQVGGFAFGLFACAMVCHGELVRLRPGPRHLTAFYLMVAAGGALGGVFVSLIAPLIFKTFTEIHLAIWLCAATGLAALVHGMRGAAPADPAPSDTPRPPTARAARVFPILRQGLICLAAMALVAAGISLLHHAVTGQRGYVYIARNFYGVLRIIDRSPASPAEHQYVLMHGRINHGVQYLSAERRREPVSYYGPDTGVALALTRYGLASAPSPHEQGNEPSAPSAAQDNAGPALPHRPMRVGTIGLGTGTVAAYGRPGDVYRFYEINPQVRELSDKKWFTFVSDSAAASVEIVMGDARLSLEREPPQNYDVLVLDAFSGDAIPVHLLTRESLALYLRHMKKGGIIAVHISNRHLDLEPVVAGLAQTFNLKMLPTQSKDDSARGLVGSRWVLLTENEAFAALPEIQEAVAAARKDHPPRKPLYWTDDFSNVFSIMKWR